MEGIITTRSGRVFLFRLDFHSSGWIAWDIHDDPGFGGKIKSHRWNVLPNGTIDLFDIDNPPETVKYIPII